MSADLMAALASVQGMSGSDASLAAASATQNGNPAGGSAQFGQLVSQGLSEVNKGLLVSQTDLQQMATGDAQNLHQVMVRLEESRLSLQLLMQVRNRLLEAYQDVMKMQV